MLQHGRQMPIRHASPPDLPAIVAIYNQAIEDRFCTADLAPRTVQDRQAWFDEHTPARFPLFVVQQDGRIAGWATLGPWRPGRVALNTVAEISYYVARERRGQGVGTALVEHALHAAEQLGYENLLALLFGVNEASLALLRRYGFTEWGRFPQIARVDGLRYDQVVWGCRLK
jgi:L-amino acid N-acyltransferase YncA